MDVCPVCGTEIRTEGPMETDYLDEETRTPQVVHEGTTYHFCDEEHKERFEADPERYV